jgi:hypothetical protein
MTGLRIIAMGFNLRRASIAARRAMDALMMERRDFAEAAASLPMSGSKVI